MDQEGLAARAAAPPKCNQRATLPSRSHRQERDSVEYGKRMMSFGWDPEARMKRTMEEKRPVALVVGATGGIGQAVAVALCDKYTVWLSGRDHNALQELADTLPSAFCWPIELSGVPDTSNVPAPRSELSLLVHCAGTFTFGPICDSSTELWRRIFDVNLLSVVDITRRLLPALRENRGRVIVVNSTAVSGSPANRAAFAANKAALRSFATALHEEELHNGVRVTSVYPGRVDTKGQHAVRAAEGGPYEADRYLSPSSVAAAILWVTAAPPDTHITEFELKPTVTWP
jgi:NADP-dependent 3-hydroxy acid dehydrogenase YdfG